MKTLQQLFNSSGLDLIVTPSLLPSAEIRGVESDSRKLESGSIFVAIRGVKQDGTVFIEEALKKGVAAAVTDSEDFFKNNSSLPLCLVSDARVAVARLSDAFYDNPSSCMKVVGITGTNGKTTVSYLVEYFLNAFKKSCGVIGTVSYRYAGQVINAVETTPGPVRLQQFLSQMHLAGCGYAAMEVSSHALDQNRVVGIRFECAAFTNLTQDHLDYHGNMDNYFACKAKLFKELPAGKKAILNADDAWNQKLQKSLSCGIITYGIDASSDVQALEINYGVDQTEFTLGFQGRKTRIHSPLVGKHNVYNVLCALGIISSLGYDLFKAAETLKDFEGVPGRLEAVRAGQNFGVFVDFAHTPDGLENVLKSLRPYTQGRLIALFGCGGDRDKTKRPKMARIAQENSDYVVVTSDNPRSEDPKQITQDVKSGFSETFKNYSIIIDRKKAIRQALMLARQGDIVVLAGKGHERYQIIGSETLPFSDRDEAQRILNGH